MQNFNDSLHWYECKLKNKQVIPTKTSYEHNKHDVTIFFPSGGPNTPLRLLSNLDIIMFWVWAAVVWAEKLINNGLYTSFCSLFNRKSWARDIRNMNTDYHQISWFLEVYCILSWWISIHVQHNKEKWQHTAQMIRDITKESDTLKISTVCT